MVAEPLLLVPAWDVGTGPLPHEGQPLLVGRPEASPGAFQKAGSMTHLLLLGLGSVGPDPHSAWQDPYDLTVSHPRASDLTACSLPSQSTDARLLHPMAWWTPSGCSPTWAWHPEVSWGLSSCGTGASHSICQLSALREHASVLPQAPAWTHSGQAGPPASPLSRATTSARAHGFLLLTVDFTPLILSRWYLPPGLEDLPACLASLQQRCLSSLRFTLCPV